MLGRWDHHIGIRLANSFPNFLPQRGTHSHQQGALSTFPFLDLPWTSLNSSLDSKRSCLISIVLAECRGLRLHKLPQPYSVAISCCQPNCPHISRIRALSAASLWGTSNCFTTASSPTPDSKRPLVAGLQGYSTTNLKLSWAMVRIIGNHYIYTHITPARRRKHTHQTLIKKTGSHGLTFPAFVHRKPDEGAPY